MEIIKQIIIKHKKITIFIAIFILLFNWMFFSDYGLLERISLEAKVIALQEENNQQQEITKTLETTILMLRTDTLEIERIAREQYGMCKPGETIYYIKK